MRVVVTGGAGFIGSHLTEALCGRGDDVLVIDDFSTGARENLVDIPGSAGLRVVTADIGDEEAAHAVRAFRPDAMVLLAAQMSVKVSMRDPLLDARANVLGLLKMLEAARASGVVKIVFASSGGTVYGSADSEGQAFDEGRPRVPLSFYGVSKSVAIDYLRVYREQYGMLSAALALGNVYGPRQDPDGEAGVISIFLKRALNGLPCVVNGDGRNTRDYVYVADVVDAFLRAIEKDGGSGLINIGRGRSTSVLDIHQAVLTATGTNLPARFGAALPGEVRHVRLDVRKAEAELGWRASTPLDEGVRAVNDWLSSISRPRDRSGLHGEAT